MTGLSVAGLSVGRAGRALLSDVRFKVPAGAALSLHGKNGLGKTTLLRVLAGLTPPLAGELSHDTDDLAYAAHADGLKATLTVAETLAFWSRLYGAGDAGRAIGAAMAAFGIAPLADRACGTLSAGQKRRCALARLRLSGRPIWLLDEPAAALDAEGQAALADVLQAHLAAGGSALLVTHGEPVFDCAKLDLGAFTPGPGADARDAFAEAIE